MRARMAIQISGLQVELRETLLKNKPAEMLRASSKGTVPVLVLDDETIIDESIDVMVWALDQHDPEGWLASARDPLIAENDGSFKRHLDRYKYAARYDDASPEEDRDAGAAFLFKLEERLSGNGWLNSSSRSFADIAIFPFVRQFRIADEKWFDDCNWPALANWLRTCMNSALFLSVMEKYAPWQKGDAPLSFGGRNTAED